MIGTLLMWLAWQRDRAKARHAAKRQLAAVAKALLTGDTSGYTFIDELPRVGDSTHVEWFDA